MRIIIAGGRDFNDYKLVVEKVSNIIIDIGWSNTEKKYTPKGFRYIAPVDKNYEIVCGKARGADTLGEQYGKEYGFKIKYFPADWDKYGKSAGYKRNEQMAIYAKEDNGVLIAFWDGQSKGTKHMIDLAKKYELKVFVINY